MGDATCQDALSERFHGRLRRDHFTGQGAGSCTNRARVAGDTVLAFASWSSKARERSTGAANAARSPMGLLDIGAAEAPMGCPQASSRRPAELGATT